MLTRRVPGNPSVLYSYEHAQEAGRRRCCLLSPSRRIDFETTDRRRCFICLVQTRNLAPYGYLEEEGKPLASYERVAGYTRCGCRLTRISGILGVVGFCRARFLYSWRARRIAQKRAREADAITHPIAEFRGFAIVLPVWRLVAFRSVRHAKLQEPYRPSRLGKVLSVLLGKTQRRPAKVVQRGNQPIAVHPHVCELQARAILDLAGFSWIATVEAAAELEDKSVRQTTCGSPTPFAS